MWSGGQGECCSIFVHDIKWVSISIGWSRVRPRKNAFMWWSTLGWCEEDHLCIQHWDESLCHNCISYWIVEDACLWLQYSMYIDDKLGKFLYSIGTLFPRYLRSNGLFMHLPEESLNDEWLPKRLFDLPRDDTYNSCGVWCLMFIEHLITNTMMDKMNSEFGEKIAVDIFHKNMELWYAL